MGERTSSDALIWRGFRFGTLLQLAVGPICLYVLQTAAGGGFFAAESAVLGVTLMDVLYIAAAILGLGALINKSARASRMLRLFGAAVLVLFGLANVLSAFGVSILPVISLTEGLSGGAFLYALILTLSNPLTIVFWAGVFAARMGEENMQQGRAALFGLGAALSTLSFLSLIAALGSVLAGLLQGMAILALNAAVGLVLIFLGIRSAFGRKKDKR